MLVTYQLSDLDSNASTAKLCGLQGVQASPEPCPINSQSMCVTVKVCV
jgi:hypothetical protein